MKIKTTDIYKILDDVWEDCKTSGNVRNILFISYETCGLHKAIENWLNTVFWERIPIYPEYDFENYKSTGRYYFKEPLDYKNKIGYLDESVNNIGYEKYCILKELVKNKSYFDIENQTKKDSYYKMVILTALKEDEGVINEYEINDTTELKECCEIYEVEPPLPKDLLDVFLNDRNKAIDNVKNNNKILKEDKDSYIKKITWQKSVFTKILLNSKFRYYLGGQYYMDGYHGRYNYGLTPDNLYRIVVFSNNQEQLEKKLKSYNFFNKEISDLLIEILNSK